MSWWDDIVDTATGLFSDDEEKDVPRETPAPALATPQPAGPALSEPPIPAQPDMPGPTDQNPAMGRAIADQSAQAARTASPEEKAELNKAIEDMGGGSVADAYNELIEKLGGKKEFDPELDKQDWGLFLMDFGMRMMAASGEWNASVGGAAGQAGVGALEGMLGRQAAEKEAVTEYNEQLGKTAEGMLPDSKDIIWTDKGAYNVRTGRPVTGPDGGVLQPGMEPGSSNRPFQRQVSQQALEGAGLNPNIAARIAQGGAPDPAELRFEFGKLFDKYAVDGENVPGMTKEGGRRVKFRELTEKQRQEWINKRVQDVYGEQGGALFTPPGPQNSRRPASMDKY